MMNLNFFRRSTFLANAVISFNGKFSIHSPLFVIWRCFSATPKYTFFSPRIKAFVIRTAFLGACYFFTAFFNIEFFITHNTFSIFSMTIPFIRCVAVHTAIISIFTAFCNIKFFSTLFTIFIFSGALSVCFYSCLAFVPWSFLRSAALYRTKLSVPSSIKFFIANWAYMHNLFHSTIIPQHPDYFEIACKRIHDALQQPTLWSVK